MMVPSHRVLNDCTLPFFCSTFKIEVQDRFVGVVDPEVLVDHPCDLTSREKVFFLLGSFFFNEDSSLGLR